MRILKKNYLVAALIFVSHFAMAQDTLLLISGRKIVVKSFDVSENGIAYRKNEPGSKVKSIDPANVFSIITKDGQERIIYQPDSLDPLDFKAEEMRSFIHGTQDARMFYKNNLLKGLGFVVGGGAAYYAFYGLIIPPLFSTFVGSFSPIVDKVLTFNVSGNAAGILGINGGKYLNRVSGTTSNPILKQNDKLKIAHTTLKFTKDTPVDSAVSLINSRFNCHRVNAFNSNGNIVLYRSDFTGYNNDNAYLEGFGKKVRDYKIRNTMICGFAGFIASSIALSIILKNNDSDK